MPIYKMDGKKDGLQKYRVRINYTDSSGKARQLDRVAYGMENAKALERQLNLDLKNSTVKRLTVKELYDEYISVKKHEVRESTLKTNTTILNKYVVDILGNTKINKLNTEVLQKWKMDIDELADKNKSLKLSTKKTIYAKFCALLNYAVKMEYIQKNYLTIIGNFRNAYEEKKIINYYTPEEFLKFTFVIYDDALETDEVWDWDYYVFYNIAFYTGMRKGEIYALKWTDIDGNILSITRSINQRINGSDRETPPKNKSSIRQIQMPEPLIRILQEHYERYSKIAGFTDDWRICGGKRCIRDQTLRNRNKKYANLAGVKEIRIHDFRHSHASLLANNGINIQEIARRLGHTEIEMTFNIYSHMYPREEERAVTVLNKIV